jgi:hypothetical protein
MVAQVGYSVVGRSRGRVTLCTIYTMHVETRSADFLAEPQNQGQWFVSGLTLKPLGRFSTVWPQNPWLGFLGLSLKTDSSSLVIWALKLPRWFLNLVLKTKRVLIYRLRHKTDRERMTRDKRQDLAACFIWKQVALEFPSLASRLTEARQRVVHVTPSWRLRRNQLENGWIDTTGCIGYCYPYFIIFYVLYHRGIVVF